MSSGAPLLLSRKLTSMYHVARWPHHRTRPHMLKEADSKPPHHLRAASMEAASYLLRWIERGRQRSEQFGTWDELSEARGRLVGMEAEDVRVFVEVSV